MAFLIEQTMVNGDTVRYHRIGEIKIDIDSNIGEAILDSYMLEQHRKLAYPVTFKRKYPFTHENNPETMWNKAYEAIKELPEFSQAIDA